MASIAPDILSHRIQRAIDTAVSSKSGIRVYSHYDADGVSAAAILSRALERAGVQFQTTLIKGLSRQFVASLDDLKSYIFMDMGSGHLPALEEKHLAVVLDHHKPERDSDSVVHVNTHLLGVDGTSEACAATLAFLFAIGLDHRNWDLVPVAVVGMVGDKQHLGGFKGVNALVVKAALEKGLLVNKRGLLVGKGSLMDALAGSFDPFFCGVSGNPGGASIFLSENGFSPEQKASMLSEEELGRLASLLALDMVGRGVDADVIRSISGSRLFDPSSKRYIDTMVEYANSSGKANMGGFGAAMLLGSPWAVETVEENFNAYRSLLLERLVELEKNGARIQGSLQYVENDDFKLNGAIAGIGMQFILPQDKPVFSLAETKDKVKISSRGTKKLTGAGLDLSVVCKMSAEKVDGEGGGHPIAAGATIPKDAKSTFLDEASKTIYSQIEN